MPDPCFISSVFPSGQLKALSTCLINIIILKVLKYYFKRQLKNNHLLCALPPESFVDMFSKS